MITKFHRNCPAGVFNYHADFRRLLWDFSLTTSIGKLWKTGYEDGDLITPLFDDVIPTLEAWKKAGKTLAIFSSGSVQAQLQFFSYVRDGAKTRDLKPLFTAHFDPTIAGSKLEKGSYEKICSDMGQKAAQVTFLTDNIKGTYQSHSTLLKISPQYSIAASVFYSPIYARRSYAPCPGRLATCLRETCPIRAFARNLSPPAPRRSSSASATLILPATASQHQPSSHQCTLFRHCRAQAINLHKQSQGSQLHVCSRRSFRFTTVTQSHSTPRCVPLMDKAAR